MHEIIGPLVEMQRKGDMAGLLAFTRMTGDLVEAMRACPQPIIAAIDGICAGAGAILAMASDMRYGTQRSKLASFSSASDRPVPIWEPAISCRELSVRVAPSCSIPGVRWMAPRPSDGASTTSSAESDAVLVQAQALAKSLAEGPTFGHAMTKSCIHQEWSMGIDNSIEAEAQAQAICMQTKDYERAYEAFVAKTKPIFNGNWDEAGSRRLTVLRARKCRKDFDRLGSRRSSV